MKGGGGGAHVLFCLEAVYCMPAADLIWRKLKDSRLHDHHVDGVVESYDGFLLLLRRTYVYLG